ncbi:MAG TPA: type II and III secretion system protein family protein [Kofleriaceae bacterium]|nr:type II and III secretion system protein family protein [Kofleriaceae bacterium]
MRTKPLLLAVLAVSLVGSGSAAADDADARIQVPLSSTKFVELGSEITRLSAGSTEIADVKAFPPDQILITGKRAGLTNATVWTRGGVQVLAIEVVYPNDQIRAALKKAIPNAKKLEVSTAGASLVLSGEVPSVEDVARAEVLARSLVAGVTGTGDIPVVNTMRVPGNQQVQLEVTFAEVSRSALKQIGFNFWSRNVNSSGSGFAGGLTSPGTSLDGLSPQTGSSPGVGGLGVGADGFTTPDPNNPDAPVGVPLTDAVPLVGNPIAGAFGFIFSSTLGGFPFSAALSLMSSKGYARTMAEPTLVALSGKSASFLAGGEFPIPLPQSLGQIGVEYRKFGVQLSFTPTILGDDIQLDLAMTVSDIDQSLGVRIGGTNVPGLTERHSQTTVRLRDGQSFVIAGLLSDKVRSNADKVPWLGSVPVIGALFRSSAYRREETELLVVVTAHRVAPLDERPELPGENTTTDPSDLELFLLNEHESIASGDRRPQRGKRIVGAVGFKR